MWKQDRMTDFVILRKEHDILLRRLVYIEKNQNVMDDNLSLHASDTALCLDRMEKEQKHFNKVLFEDRCFLERIEKLLESVLHELSVIAWKVKELDERTGEMKE